MCDPEGSDLLQALAEAGLAADDTALLPHDVAQAALERTGKLGSRPRERIKLPERVVNRPPRPGEELSPEREPRRCLARTSARDQRLAERIPAQPVRPVEAADTFARRVEAGNFRRVSFGIDHDASHRVVSRRRDLHRLPRDVEHLPLDELGYIRGSFSLM